MLISIRRWMIAFAVALYLYLLLPATADLFYELYHLTHIGPVYWLYSGFKAAGYYLGVYEYRVLACLLLAAPIVIVPAIINKIRGEKVQ
jgi:hypothetical protein